MTDSTAEDVIPELEALGEEYGRENVMEAVHILLFGDEEWSEADGIGYQRVTEGSTD